MFSIKKYLIELLERKYKDWDISIALRYLPIVETIKSDYSPKVKILEIGSGNLGVLPYLDDRYSITGVDVNFGSEIHPRLKPVVVSDVKLPFADNSFDLVISVDVLEHIPETDRKVFLSECIRVTKKQLFLAFPSGSYAKFADSFLDRYYRFTHKQPFPFLSEHKANGLPDKKQTVSRLKYPLEKMGKQADMKVFGNTNVFLWIFLLILGFSQVTFLTFIFRLLPIFLGLFKHMHFWPTYRQIIFVNIKDNSQKS